MRPGVRSDDAIRRLPGFERSARPGDPERVGIPEHPYPMINASSTDGNNQSNFSGFDAGATRGSRSLGSSILGG